MSADLYKMSYALEHIWREEISIIAKIKNKIDNAGNKVAGKIKETVGKATGNEKLEVKGIIQSKKADIKGKIEKVTDKKRDNISS
jgi:uncharacterized protein YjbJ (UPF0337 family)